MMELLANLKNGLETIGKIKNAFESLKHSRLLIKETDIFNLVEKHFSLEPLPKGILKLRGRLSNYTLSNNFPIYTPAHLFASRQSKISKLDEISKQVQDGLQLELKVNALNIPTISFQPIELSDKGKAKVLWLYPEDSNGLVYTISAKTGLVRNNLCEVFGIGNSDKPIPILVDMDFPNYLLYKTVKISGTIYTSPIDLFNQFANETDPFTLDYFSNCFRPLSSQEGILAIDARKPMGKIEAIDQKSRPFKIIYTVQGYVEIPEEFDGKLNLDLVMNECIDSIPDRQGLGPIRVIGDSINPSYSIVSIGNTFWQKDINTMGIAAFTEINLTDASYNQARLMELANNWQVWQKTARKRIRENFGIEPKIRPLICSNSIHKKNFHPNGLQISKTVEEKLLSNNPTVRKSIDWLGISVGKN